MNCEVLPAASEIAPRRFKPVYTGPRERVPFSGSMSINALERKFQETLGEIKRLDEALYDWDGRDGFDLASKYEIELRARHQAALISLENSIRILDPKCDRKRLMAPKIKRGPRRPLFEDRKFQNALVALLRREPRGWSTNEIALELAPQLGLPNPTADQRRRMRGMAYGSLRKYYDKGLVDCVGSNPARWFARSHLETR